MERALVIPQSIYINPYTDFGFKKLFGEEGSKDLLIDFLNTLLPSEYQIVDIEFRNTENNSEIKSLRKAIFDIHCENEKKDKFIVEMQKSQLEYFKDRIIWYTTFPIRNQAPKGKILKIVNGEEKEIEWDFNLKPVYFVGILDFEFADTTKNSETDYVVEVEYKDQNNKVFYNKMKYFFIVMPRFNKKESELKTHKDKWIYFLKNLESFEDIPQILNEPIFKKGFELAKILNYNEKQLEEYEASYNDYLSFKGSIDFSFKNGLEKGIEQERLRNEKLQKEKELQQIKKMIQKGSSNEDIMDLFDYQISELEKIRLDLK